MRLCLLLLPALLAAACSEAEPDFRGGIVKESFDYYAERINRYIYAGRQDSVVIDMTPHFYRAISRRDTAVCQLLGASIAQAWLELENRDSVSRYIEMLQPYMAGVEGGSAFIIYYNMLGGYALKYQADYSGALSHYLKVLDFAKKQEIIPAQIGMLYNIVYIFYIRMDPHCEPYARLALSLSEHPGVSFFTRIAALIAATESEYLNQSYDKALGYLRQAHEESLEHNTGYWNPIVYMLQGDILTAEKQYDKAIRSYEMALGESANSEPSTIISILYNYGCLCQASGRLQKADELYRQALDKCAETGSTEFLVQLLRAMVELHIQTGDIDTVAYYYNELIDKEDKFDFQTGVGDFKNSLFEYSSLQYEYDITRKSLELSENRRTTGLLVFFVSVAALCVVFVLLLYSRQRRENKRLIAQYEEYRKRLLTENSVNDRTAADHRSDIHYALYLKMEQLMKAGLFREKELTLDRMAEVLGTNRTYVSNALNKVAGISFYGYIDSYRIKEATRVLSDSALSEGISLKQLADDVGYNNIQTFFKAFKRETGVTPGNYKKEVLNLRKFTQGEQ
ncbi:helix-turn-helix domain-containing protein [uncultured Alistipes sp.]|uniref:helix-turn-helix domain-containing protein n=1 Tax=uncultured Alistipes sp. TaxID=538949 RepID=UPI002803B67A|nr:helix-turn-helix domain-containing protein [uncultured Alistipes sp.]